MHTKLILEKMKEINQLRDIVVDRRTRYSKSYQNEVYERELDRPGSINFFNFWVTQRDKFLGQRSQYDLF
jgi:hypothetical protein